jgi:hypothetical protein
MIYDTSSTAYKTYLTVPPTRLNFTCQICLDDKELREKMPESSLGCGCGGNICVQCFYTDFQARQKPIWIDEHGGAMSLWDDPLELQMHLEDVFEETHDPEAASYDDEFEVFLLENFHVGKRCPFCNQTCVWWLDQTPRILPATGRLTMWSPVAVQPLPIPQGE